MFWLFSCVPVVTLSTENYKKLLEQLRTGFKRTIKWNKYRSEITNQTKNNNLNYLVDPTFTKVNRVFVLSFENENDRTSFSKYYVRSVQTIGYNVLIDRKRFFRNTNKEWRRNIRTNNGNGKKQWLHDWQIVILWLLSQTLQINCNRFKQIELENPDLKQQINFIERLERKGGAAMFFIIENWEETIFEFIQNAATVVWFWLWFCIKMETQKFVNLLSDADNESSKFATRNWCVINDQNNTDYGEGNESGTTDKFETKVIKSSDYSDAYMVVTGDITAIGGDVNTRVAFKNCARFKKCITHIKDGHVDGVENLDIKIPMYTLIEYSDNYSKTSVCLWQFKRDESPVNKDGNPVNISTANSSSFNYKSSSFKPLTAANNGVFKNVKIVIPLKYFGNFWRSFRNAID